jgi:DNA-directed RNA polymerase subunit RPC12/RpoP
MPLCPAGRTYDEETLATRRFLGQPTSVGRVSSTWGVFPGGMIICPRCASRRVVLLTFPEDEPVRTKSAPQPIARCADCGHRLTPQEITTQEKPSLN